MLNNCLLNFSIYVIKSIVKIKQINKKIKILRINKTININNNFDLNKS
jgi:hypothetical protein